MKPNSWGVWCVYKSKKSPPLACKHNPKELLQAWCNIKRCVFSSRVVQYIMIVIRFVSQCLLETNETQLYVIICFCGVWDSGRCALPDSLSSERFSNNNSIFKSNQIESNQIKSLLLSHHHSTSALVSEILMSVLQTVQKNNRQLPMDRQCKKKQQTIYLWTDSAKKQQTIYLWTDSAKKNNKQFTYGQTVQKNNKQFTYGQTVQKKQQQFTYGQTVQKKTTAIYIWTDSAKNNSNLHMDSTYLQTVQKTMCKIHIHILSTLSVTKRTNKLLTSTTIAHSMVWDLIKHVILKTLVPKVSHCFCNRHEWNSSDFHLCI